MVSFGMNLAALLAPLAVWGLILASMARTAGPSRPDPLNDRDFPDAEIVRVSPPSPEDKAEEEHARARLANVLYEEDFNYNRAA